MEALQPLLRLKLIQGPEMFKLQDQDLLLLNKLNLPVEISQLQSLLHLHLNHLLPSNLLHLLLLHHKEILNLIKSDLNQ
jgi:hypothetical protein